MKYINGASAKLYNRKIMVRDMNDSILIQFAKYDESECVTCVHRHLRKKIHLTDITLTKEAAIALLLCLRETLKNKES